MIEDLWNEIPSDFYIAVGHTGQEAITSEQCFLEGCNNHDIKKLHPMEKEFTKSKIQEDGAYFECTRITIKCEVCGGVFQFGLKVVYPPNYTKKKGAIMGLGYIFDGDGKDLGFIGYF